MVRGPGGNVSLKVLGDRAIASCAGGRGRSEYMGLCRESTRWEGHLEFRFVFAFDMLLQHPYTARVHAVVNVSPWK